LTGLCSRPATYNVSQPEDKSQKVGSEAIPFLIAQNKLADMKHAGLVMFTSTKTFTKYILQQQTLLFRIYGTVRQSSMF
jgi:hypothetical protein